MSNKTYKGASIRAELLALKDAQGLVNPRVAVAWARSNPHSLLHANLPWDDKYAAEEHRVHLVRQLIAVHVVDATGQRQLISLSTDRAVDGGYRPLEEIIQRKDWVEVMLEDALVDLQRLQAKYQRLTALSPVWDATDQVRKKQRRKGAAKKAAPKRGGSGRTSPRPRA